MLENTHPAPPPRLALLASLGLAWLWAIVAVGVGKHISSLDRTPGLIASAGLNALVKSNQLKTYVKHVVPSPTVVVINDNGKHLVDLVSPAWRFHIPHRHVSSWRSSHHRICPYRRLVHAIRFIPYARPAFFDGTQYSRRLPGVLRRLAIFSFSPPHTVLPNAKRHCECVYRRTVASGRSHPNRRASAWTDEQIQGYVFLWVFQQGMHIQSILTVGAVRLVAILPWFSLLFATIASVMLFVAASRVSRLEASGDSNKASVTSNANPDIA